MRRLGGIILAIGLIWAQAGCACAQLFVVHPQSGTIGEYNVETGAPINASLITGLTHPQGICLDGNFLYVTEWANNGAGKVGKYDAKSGAPINPDLVTGLTLPSGVAVSGNDLFVTQFDGQGTGMVSKYNASTGAPINVLLVSRLESPQNVVVKDGKVFVIYSYGYGALGEYDANTGAVINPIVAQMGASSGLALANNYFWFTSGDNAPNGAVFKYDAETLKNVMGFARRPFIYKLNYPNSIAISGDYMFVSSSTDGVVSKFSAIDGSSINAVYLSGLKDDIAGITAISAPVSSGAALQSQEFGILQSILAFFMWCLYDFNFVYVIGSFVIGLLLLWALLMFWRQRSEPAVEAAVQNPEDSPQEEAPKETVPQRSLVKPMLIGSVVLVVLLIVGFIAYEKAVSLYLERMESLKVVARQQVEAEQKKTLPPVQLAVPSTGETMPATIVDPENFKTENNWLAALIGKRIASLAYLALHPTQTSVPDIKVQAKVDAEQHQVHLEITGFSSDPVVIDVQPEFAWDPQSYSIVAAKLLGNLPTDSSKPSDPLPDELTTLLQPTTANLAAEDVSLSALLQKYPTWSAVHEQAALLLVALALRDRAWVYGDSRAMLCRATAHLAMAQALRGPAVPTWSGQIADAAIRVLSGREVDALAHLDALAARADCPDSAKSWIDALRLRAKDDWRVVTPNAKSPLLLKIAWAQVLNDNLSSLVAADKLNTLGDDLEKVSDWGHAALTNRVAGSVQTSNEYCDSTTGQELKELSQALTTEGVSSVPGQRIGEVLSEPLQEKLYVGEPPVLKILGPDMFKDFARQHLTIELSMSINWLSTLLGEEDDAKKFRIATWEQFAGMRRFENLGFFAEQYFNATDVNRELQKEKVTWAPWELTDGKMPGNPNLGDIHPDIDTVNGFYQDGMPFGTVYNIDDRMNTLYIGAGNHKRQSLADINYNFPTYPYAKDLQKLAPSSFTVFLLDKNQRDFFQITQPWWDYNLLSIDTARKLFDSLDEEDNTKLLNKLATLNPDAWFMLGDYLRKNGKDDEAAVADQKGYNEGFDKVLMSNRIGPLVDYYYDHDRKDDALKIAERAADVYSEQGLLTYCKILEKTGLLPEAEKNAQAIADRYGDRSALDRLYAAHKDVFQDQNRALIDQVFPHGTDKVTLTSFKDAPIRGCVFNSDSALLQQASLLEGDVVVGLDGYRIENEAQYDYVRALSTDPHMDFIIWRKDRYLEVHASAPNRIFNVDLIDYPAPTHL